MSFKYTATFDQKLTIKVKGFEAPVSIPDKPAARYFINYGKDKKDQKFKRTEFPDWEQMSFYDKQKLVSEETHKRIHGNWYLINGQEVYVNGWAYFYFSYWYCEFGGLPDFRMEAVDFFLVWDHCVRDKNCFGLFDIKGRRIGDTEKSLCIMYDMATRYKNSWCGHQNIKDDDAKGNFDRIVKAHQKMQPFFKPVNSGGDAPKSELVFEFPGKSDADTLTDRSKSTANTSRGVGSKIDFRPTTLAQYDGKRLRVYYLDEPGKLDHMRMSAKKQWGIIKPCLTLNNQKRIIGKAIFTTTVENIKNGLSLDYCRETWEISNPNIKMADGRTESGLYRYFRDYLLASEVDEFGFPKEDEARLHRQSQMQAFVRTGDLSGLSDYKRRFPETIDDALATPSTACILFPELLDGQQEYIRNVAIRGTQKERERLAVRGDLIWERGFASKVIWQPNATSGKWWIAQHPVAPNNVQLVGGYSTPVNNGVYTIGVDPIDHIKPQEGHFSYGAISVFMPENAIYENPEAYAEDGSGDMIYPWMSRTDQYVCTYKNRPHDPKELFDDIVKTAWYYGVQAFIERDKPGVINFMKDRNLHRFLGYKPLGLGIGMNREAEAGMKTSAQSLNLMIDQIKSHVSRKVGTYRFPELLTEYRNFTGENTRQSDLLIASGLALIMALPIQAASNRKKRTWSELPV